MLRTFVVVRKTVAVMTDLNCRFIELDEVDLACRAVTLRRLAFAENWVERVLREDVFDVGDEKFLMLLLMMNSKGEDRFDLTKKFFVGARNQIVHVRIDFRAVTLRFFDGRTRNQPAQIPPMHSAGCVVVGIKKVSVFRNDVVIARHPFFQNESFEKPGGMREMPLGRTDLGHRLHDAVFGFEVSGKTRREIPDLMKTRKQALRPRKLFRGRRFLYCCDRAVVQVIPPSCSSSSRRASSI